MKKWRSLWSLVLVLGACETADRPGAVESMPESESQTEADTEISSETLQTTESQGATDTSTDGTAVESDPDSLSESQWPGSDSISASHGDTEPGDTQTSDSDSFPDSDTIDQLLEVMGTSCTPADPVEPSCNQGTFDRQTGYCSDGTNAYGPFSPGLVEACKAAGGGSACDTERWGAAFLRNLLDDNSLLEVDLLGVLEEIQSRPWVYCQPTAQDKEGNGIYKEGGLDVPASDRSEQTYLPFILGPRRQVDSLVRQLYLLLPETVRESTAFVVADRFVAKPEAYMKYVRSRQKVVVVGSFVGIGTSTTLPDWAADRHADEMWKLRESLRLVRALNREVSDVVYAMGDSSTSFGLTVREALQTRLRRILASADLASLDAKVTWGADETVHIGLARSLGPAKILLHVENPEAQHHYDGMRTTAEILAEKLPQLRLLEVDSGQDFEVAILTRRPGGSASDYQAGDTAQAILDDAFLEPFASYSPQERRRLVILDARIFNGAWDSRAAQAGGCDLLTFGSWGTFGNNVGATLAAARIVLASGNDQARRQLVLEAIGHDVFANGYEEAQRGELRDRIDAELGAGTFNHWAGYGTAQLTQEVFAIVNEFVNERMNALFSGSQCMDDQSLRLTPQLWRTFESEVHLLPARASEVQAVGVYRVDLGLDFDPTLGNGPPFVLLDLLAEP